MFYGPNSLPSSSTAQLAGGQQSAVDAFEWLIVLGFPVDVAAAKVMPELFSDATVSVGR